MTWIGFSLWLLEHVAKVKYQISGSIDPELSRTLIVSNHQSTWETLAFFKMFPKAGFALKEELVKLPVIGLYIASLDIITIKRTSAVKALKQLTSKAKSHLESGKNLVIFPEGTRVAYGTVGKWKPGAAGIIAETNCPITFVTHDAGRYWPRRSWVCYPGTIKVTISETFHLAGSIRHINQQLRAKINDPMGNSHD